MDRFEREQLDLLIEDLGLVPSTFMTESLKDLITKDIQMREFEPMNDLERYYHNQYLKELSQRQKPRKPVITGDDLSLFLFENGLS